MVQLFYGTFLTEGVREGKVCLCPVCVLSPVTGSHCFIVAGRQDRFESPDLKLFRKVVLGSHTQMIQVLCPCWDD